MSKEDINIDDFSEEDETDRLFDRDREEEDDESHHQLELEDFERFFKPFIVLNCNPLIVVKSMKDETPVRT